MQTRPSKDEKSLSRNNENIKIRTSTFFKPSSCKPSWTKSKNCLLYVYVFVICVFTNEWEEKI